MNNKRKDLSGEIINGFKLNYRIEDHITKGGIKRAQYNCTCLNCGYSFNELAMHIKNKERSKRICGQCQKKRNIAFDLNKKYGFITPIEFIDTKRVLCLCDCGNIFITYKNHLRTGKTKSCGCKRYEMHTNRKDITGIKINMLTAIKYLRTNEYGCAIWLFQCDCGNYTKCRVGDFLQGNKISCGCIKKSKGEIEIENILNYHKLDYTTEYMFQDLRHKNPLRFDFALFDKNKELLGLIEFQGKQHYEDIEYGKQQREITDNMKRNYCKENKIQLFEIKYCDNINERIQEIIYKLYGNTVPST